MIKSLKENLKSIIKRTNIGKNLVYWIRLYSSYSKSLRISKFCYFKQSYKNFCVEPTCASKAIQIANLLRKVDLNPVKSKYFFYSIDCFKTVQISNPILDNYTIDYSKIIDGDFKQLKTQLEKDNSKLSKELLILIDGFHSYYDRIVHSPLMKQYSVALRHIKSIFYAPASSFLQALQRILFINQMLWQTRHQHNGLGRLDFYLNRLYSNDIENGIITREEAKEIIKDFFIVLHSNYWYKSSALLGDTGQIIILGGLDNNENYFHTDLTDLFIEVSEELKLPDPKILLRCSSKMDDNLLAKALNCIATGIGAPLLANDDIIIPSLIACGYDKKDSSNYVTAACWEPLISGKSSDLSNFSSLNFAEPFVEMLNTEKNLDVFSNLDELLEKFFEYLRDYINNILTDLSTIVCEEDPLLSLLSSSAIASERDITRGGAEYNNIGVTSVGLPSVVDSLNSIKNIVFELKQHRLCELNNFRQSDFTEHKEVIEQLKSYNIYGTDDSFAVGLTEKIAAFASNEFKKYHTHYGGIFKFGLSSPAYITDASRTEALFDGRLSGQPFNVHISSRKTVSPIELFQFAGKLNYAGNRVNGNVIDFMIAPNELKTNFEKYVLFLKRGFSNGIFEIQINVVDSKTLIEAKRDPSLHPNLVVRVWGFSSYFNDLPEEYKDNLIRRALEMERAA